MEVPYKPFYAFEETLATFGDDPGSPASLLSSFERITDAVTAGQVTAMRPIAEDLRLQYKDIFTRRQPAPSTQVYLSYAPEDRMWADWIEAVLTRAGFRVLPRSTVVTAAGGTVMVPAASMPSVSSRWRPAPSPCCRLRTCIHSTPGPSGRRCRRPTPPTRTGS